MKRIMLFLCAYPLLLIIFLVSGCIKDKPITTINPEPNLKVQNLESLYGCPDSRYSLNINLVDTFTLIQDQDTFDKLVSGDCKPTIDFDSYNLLIGKKGLLSGNDSIRYEIEKTSDGTGLNVKVIFLQNITTVAPNITYNVLLPKEFELKNINVETVVTY